LLPLLSACVTSRSHQQVVAEKDAQIRELHEERSTLKHQIQGLKSQLDNAHGELADASSRTITPAAAQDVRDEAMPELDSVGVTYGRRNGNMTLSIPSSITFPSGEATLSKAGEKALRQVASTLKQKYAGAVFSIEGHTDTDPIKKSKFQTNRDLSIARARAVHTFLVVECGVPDAKCVVVGHGEYDPVAPNSGEKDKARNRRVEVVVHGR
jgi:chemotaxis protein MotB